MKLSNKAFSFPELLVAVAILSFTLTGILASLIHTMILNNASSNLTVATSHAEIVLEQIRNTSFANISTNISDGNWNWSASTIASNNLTPLNSEAISVQSSGTTLLDITATVTWKDLQQRSRSTSLRTLVSN
jgi:type II secretory pathway pseudopilin PulG